MVRIRLSQFNPTIGNLEGNTQKIISAIEQAKKEQIDLIVFPELALCGYPPEDLLLMPYFMKAVFERLEDIVAASHGIGVLVGVPRYHRQPLEKGLYNSAALIENGKLIDFADKILLPTYDVFDERRYFESGNEVKVWPFRGQFFAITICEDLWEHAQLLKNTSYQRDPIAELKGQGLTCLINLSASPYSLGKPEKRQSVCLSAAFSLQCPVLLCNQVGGNDSLLFDGHSLYVSPKGEIQKAKGFQEDALTLDLSSPPTESISHTQDPAAELYHALVMGVRDYFKKSGFTKGCLGLSGGIDSSVVACILTEAIGPENVLAVYMPSRYSSLESARDAKALAEALKISYKEISIEPIFQSYLETLAPSFQGLASDITEENLQARIRGALLMSLSNKFHSLLVATGNKSELALGYCTLYGDMCGSLAVIGDLAKREVYQIAYWINRLKEVIPAYVLLREPSAELRPNQKDSDSLPDYAIVDNVLAAYIEEHQSPQWIAHHFNYDEEVVNRLVNQIHANEYKRRQAPPVLRISEKAFSSGRKFPIAERWRI